ncbi:cytochrome c maturation protein CcmE [Parasphingopyxis algicola]|uniref:cytochrome c maturation protein CcmE n=1 Tax=Parasphingopyxis algicola TaxID=2026624 RepID=UPI0015A13600|nr:cytochrome c maturation protein CcmE [Parasphingopyxis algicola]QLC24077.1 cytochrome c maturation protein CcmE [Parasphingopyxis algicola]
MRAKHQRLTLAIIAIVAVVAAGFLALFGLRDNAALFRTPAEISAEPVPAGQAFRLGGMVAQGSIEELPDGVSIRFLVQDAEAQVPVVYAGITPDLFAENSGVVAEGALDANGVFVADHILAKHDENYMPPELADVDLVGDPRQ